MKSAVVWERGQDPGEVGRVEAVGWEDEGGT